MRASRSAQRMNPKPSFRLVITPCNRKYPLQPPLWKCKTHYAEHAITAIPLITVTFVGSQEQPVYKHNCKLLSAQTVSEYPIEISVDIKIKTTL